MFIIHLHTVLLLFDTDICLELEIELPGGEFDERSMLFSLLDAASTGNTAAAAELKIWSGAWYNVQQVGAEAQQSANDSLPVSYQFIPTLDNDGYDVKNRTVMHFCSAQLKKSVPWNRQVRIDVQPAAYTWHDALVSWFAVLSLSTTIVNSLFPMRTLPGKRYRICWCGSYNNKDATADTASSSF